MKLTQTKREIEKIQRMQKIRSIILENPGLNKNEIKRLASDKSKPDWMNKNTAAEYIDKLTANGEVKVKKSSSGYRYYFTPDYYTQEALDEILDKEIIKITNNFEKSIKKLKDEFDKVNDLGKNEIFEYLEKIEYYLEEKLDLFQRHYDDLDLHYNDEYIKEFGKYCKNHRNQKAVKILHNAEKMYGRYTENQKQIKNIRENISLEKNKDKLHDLVMEFLSRKGIENQLFRELQKLHNEMFEIKEKKPKSKSFLK